MGDPLDQSGLTHHGNMNNLGFLCGAGAHMLTDLQVVVRVFFDQACLGWNDDAPEQDNFILHDLLHGASDHILTDSILEFCFSIWMIDEIFSDGVPLPIIGHGHFHEEGSGWVAMLLHVLPLGDPLFRHDFHLPDEIVDLALVCDEKSLVSSQVVFAPICLDNQITQITAWAPWDKCCRLGEASNPGPAGQEEFFHHTTVNVTKLRTSLDDIFTLWKNFREPSALRKHQQICSAYNTLRKQRTS